MGHSSAMLGSCKMLVLSSFACEEDFVLVCKAKLRKLYNICADVGPDLTQTARLCESCLIYLYKNRMVFYRKHVKAEERNIRLKTAK